MKNRTNLESPTVSVITPTLNRARRIPGAIKSVLNQTFKDWEHIIIDAGSTDNTEDVVRRFPDHRIIYINRFKLRGISDTRNMGLRLAAGKYIAFLDSDDTLPYESLAIRARYLSKHPKTALVFGKWDIERSVKYTKVLKKVFPGQKTKPQIKKEFPRSPEMDIMKTLKTPREKFNLLMKRNFIPTGSVMVRKEVLDQLGGFDLSFIVAEDYDLWLRIAKKHNIDFIDKVLLHSRRFDDSISLSAQKQKILTKLCRLAKEKNR